MKHRFAYVVVILAAACAHRGPPSPPIAAPPLLHPDSTHTSDAQPRTLKPDSGDFSIDVFSQAQELGENHRSDSTHRHSQFQVRLSNHNPTWELRLKGQRVVVDSATISNPKRTAADSTDSLTILLNDDAKRIVTGVTVAPKCTGGGALLSPLIARVLIPPVSNNLPRGQSERDSLAYVACSSGTELSTIVEITFSENEKSQIKVTITGRLQSDSTKRLPLRISGSISGTGLVTLPDLQSPFAKDIDLDLLFDISAESSLKMQKFKQRTTIRVRVLP